MNTVGKPLNECVAVVEKKVPDQKLTMKFKANDRGDLSLSAKLPLYGLEDIATVTKGVKFSNLTSEKRSWNYGWQIDLNI